MSDLLTEITTARAEAEVKAWKALAGYKFYMFGYWAAAWVKYNQLVPRGLKEGNPFKDLVNVGKMDVSARELRAARLGGGL